MVAAIVEEVRMDLGPPALDNETHNAQDLYRIFIDTVTDTRKDTLIRLFLYQNSILSNTWAQLFSRRKDHRQE